MPNHVKNRLTGPKEVLDVICGEREGKPIVDFALVIPVPPEIVNGNVAMHVEGAALIALGTIDWNNPPRNNALADFQSGNYGGAAAVLGFQNHVSQLTKGPFPKDFSDEDFETFVAYMRAYRTCGGLMHGLDWNRAKWGTKWNAYDACRESETVLTFETAWSAPHPVMQALAMKTKGSFKHEWADEDTGNNVGWIDYIDGIEADGKELSKTNEGYELCFNLDPDKKEYYRLIDGKYEWFDADEEEEVTSAT